MRRWRPSIRTFPIVEIYEDLIRVRSISACSNTVANAAVADGNSLEIDVGIARGVAIHDAVGQSWHINACVTLSGDEEIVPVTAQPNTDTGERGQQ